MNGDTTASTRNFISSQIDDRASALGNRVTRAADEIRAIGDQLRQAPLGSQIAPLTERGAKVVASVGTYLTEGDTQRFVADLEDLTRRRPVAVTSGAVVVGFLASRFLKTSASSAKYQARVADPTRGSNTPQMTSYAADTTDA
jgi:hypothetical protein